MEKTTSQNYVAMYGESKNKAHDSIVSSDSNQLRYSTTCGNIVIELNDDCIDEMNQGKLCTLGGGESFYSND